MLQVLGIIIFTLITLSLSIYAGYCNAVMDVLASKYEDSVFAYKNNPTYWDKTESANNKYKNGDKYQGPAFKGSTTYKVYKTDAWHLYQHRFFLTLALQMVFFGILGYLIPFDIYFIVPALAILAVKAWVIFGYTFEVYHSDKLMMY